MRARESEEEMKKNAIFRNPKLMKETKKRNEHFAIIARNIITEHKI